MKIRFRRAFSALLAAALILGSMPPSAQAHVARVAAGETGGMPVSPFAGSAAAPMMAPISFLGAANLGGTLSPSSIAPSPAADKPLEGPASQATALNAAVAGALPVSAPAAAGNDAPKLPDAPKAAAPVEKKTWIKSVSALFGRKPAAAEAPSAEASKASVDLAFDGAVAKTGESKGPAVSGQSFAPRPSGLKAAKREPARDEFGGPRAEPMNFRQRVGYGLKQGLNLVGIGAILELTLHPILNAFPWPQYLSDRALQAFGRVALLVKYGPNDIVAGLANSPNTFLGINLPIAVATEEFTYRLLGFGMTFLAIAAVKPAARWVSSLIEGIPNAAGAVGGAKLLLKIGEFVSRLAFPIAAVLSAARFSADHIGAWGFNPFLLLFNGILGLFLASTAYKSRSLTSPILAHLLFNLVTIGAILVGMSYSPLAGAAFTIIAALIGVSSLLHDYLSERKVRAFRLGTGAKALASIMLVGAGFSMWQEGPQNASRGAATQIEQVADKTTETAPVAAVPNTSAKMDKPSNPAESFPDMVARLKPAVVNVIVENYGTGSGFILTPDGIFITNGHVVGYKRPGEFIKVRLPGVDTELRAEVLAVNHDKDLAIARITAVRMDGKPWPTVKLAANATREGDTAIAMGYPRGLPFSVSKGIVSGMDGRGTMYVHKLQTDAAINPGNSGGPLFNDRGEVIGVNTEIKTQSGGFEGISIAITAPEVQHVMDQYVKTGNIATASLGIIANLSDPQAPEAGLEIEHVRPGSAAEKAGLRRGDLITKIGKVPLPQGRQHAVGRIAVALSRMVPGQKTTVTILRGEDHMELELTVDAKATPQPRH